MNPTRFLLPLILCCGFLGSAQYKYEREFRILKKQFPEKALLFLEDKIDGAKRVRYYKEVDSTKISYETKLKKDKLHYSIEFNEEGVLEDIEITINKVDVPNESWQNIEKYLNGNFQKSKISKIQQQYPALDGESPGHTLKNAFQNLLLPSLNYELIISAKEDGDYQQYEILFDAEGSFKKLRKSLPPNYDHVLY
ncbi:MAG: hypothetical protein AAFX53_06815 [Bacteroidota bacterium]